MADGDGNFGIGRFFGPGGLHSIDKTARKHHERYLERIDIMGNSSAVIGDCGLVGYRERFVVVCVAEGAKKCFAAGRHDGMFHSFRNGMADSFETVSIIADYKKGELTIV